MIGDERVLALIPARSGSKGLPHKNIRELDDRPLLAWPIKTAAGSLFVDRVVVSTDSEAYSQIAQNHGAEVPFLRPPELATDSTPSCDVVVHALDQLSDDTFGIVVLLEPTAPLTSIADIDGALDRLVTSGADAVVGVKALVTEHPSFAFTEDATSRLRPYDTRGMGLDLPRRQDLPPAFALSGALYVSRVERYFRDRSFVHDNTLGYQLPAHRSIEIDTLLDFVIVEAVLENWDALEAASR